MSSCILPYLLVEFFSLFWNILLCLYRFILYRYLFSFTSFASIFWFISLCCIDCFTCVASLFSSQNIPAFLLVVDFLSLFPVKFPIQALRVFFVIFRGTPLLSLTNFVSFLMLFIEISSNKIKNKCNVQCVQKERKKEREKEWKIESCDFLLATSKGKGNESRQTVKSAVVTAGWF